MKSQPSSAPRRKPSIAQIRISGQGFSIGREPFELIADRPLYGSVQQGKHKPAVTLRYIAETGRGLPPRRLVTLPFGLLELVETMLRDEGWATNVRPSRHLRYYCPHRFPGESGWSCPELLRRAYGRRRTLAEVPSLEQRLTTIAALREQFPENHILVVEKNKAAAKATADALSRLIASPVSYGIGDRDTDPWTHVDCVGTFAGRSLLDWSFVVFIDAELALSMTSTNQLAPMFGSARIGFLQRDERELQEMERAILECLFGPVIYRPGETADSTKVAVAWIAAPSYSPVDGSNRLNLKRQNIWQNDARNRQIALVARAFECGDRLAARRLGLGEAADWISQSDPCEGVTVAIVVENPEHGHELAKYLRNWKLLTTLVSANDETGPVLWPKSIVTLPRALKSGVASNVVIYAAGTGERWLDCLGPQCEVFSGSKMLVVDVADDCDHITIRQFQCRANDYRHRGWQVSLGRRREKNRKGGIST